MSAKPRIFISAVSKELHSARQLVANTLAFLGYEPVWQEIFGTEQGDVQEMLRRKIDTCQGVIQLTGQRFGFGSTNPASDEHAVSYTQYELHYARERGMKVWPVILAEEFPADALNDEPEAHRKNQERYRQSLAPRPTDHAPAVPLYQQAANPTDLENVILKLRNDLEILRVEWSKQQRRASRVIAGTAVGVLLLLGLVWWVKRDTAQTKITATEIKTNTAQLKIILTDYVERRTADAAIGERGDEATREHALLAELDKKYGLPAGTLTNQLPAFAKKLAVDGTATKYERAEGAFAARDYVEAERLALEAAVEARKALPLDKGQIIEALELAGWSARERRADAKVLAHFTEASALTDKAREPLEWARVHHALAYTINDNGVYEHAVRLLRQVIPIRTKELGPEHPDTLNSRNNLGLALWEQDNSAEAEVEHRAVLKIRERVLGPEHPDTLNSRNNLGLALCGQDKSAEAEVEHRTVLKIRERVLGPENPYTLTSRNNLGLALHEQGKYAEAEAEHRAVLKIMERVLGPEHPVTLTSRNNLGRALYAQGKFAEAEAEHRAVIKLRERVLGLGHPETLKSRSNLGLALYAQDKFVEAEAEHRAVIKLRERVLGTEHPKTLTSLYNLALCLKEQNKIEDAWEYARRAMEGLRKVLGAEHSGTKNAEQLYQDLTAPK